MKNIFNMLSEVTPAVDRTMGENVIDSLHIFWKGMLAIAIVLAVVFAVTILMTFISNKIKDKKKAEAERAAAEQGNQNQQ